jgi:hypothetical protein
MEMIVRRNDIKASPKYANWTRRTPGAPEGGAPGEAG